MGGKIICGAGTVMNSAQVHNAAVAGAQFISCIHSDEDLIKEIKGVDKACIAGALTPTNIISAKESGVDFINIFRRYQLGKTILNKLKVLLMISFCLQ